MAPQLEFLSKRICRNPINLKLLKNNDQSILVYDFLHFSPFMQSAQDCDQQTTAQIQRDTY